MGDYICAKCGKTETSDNDGLPNGWITSKDEYDNEVELCSVECMKIYDELIEKLNKED